MEATFSSETSIDFHALHDVIYQKTEFFKPCIAEIKLIFYLCLLLFTFLMQI
jgi:hypothetical protein